MTIAALIGVLSGKRFNYSSERQLQDQIEEILKRLNIWYKREFSLSSKDRIDFLVEDGIGLEIKIKGSAMEIHRQIERYLEHTSVGELLLVTSKSIGLAKYKKRVEIFNVSRNWL